MKWYSLLFTAVVVEALITYAKTLFVNRVFQWQILASMILGASAALVFGIDLFEIAGVSSQLPLVGQVLTGILISRGSNYVFDLLGKLTDIKTSKPAVLEAAAEVVQSVSETDFAAAQGTERGSEQILPAADDGCAADKTQQKEESPDFDEPQQEA